MKASTETMAAFAAAIGQFPAALVLHNNTWRPYVDSWTATMVGPYSKADITVKSRDELTRVVGNCEAQAVLNWRGSADALFVTLQAPAKPPVPAPVPAPESVIDGATDAPPPADTPPAPEAQEAPPAPETPPAPVAPEAPPVVAKSPVAPVKATGKKIK